jgi:hypothetical protein
MESSWRSWFWNVVLMFILLVMGGLTFPVAFQPMAVGWKILFLVMSLVALAGSMRALFLGVFAGPQGITMRGLTHTTKIPWAEVEEITTDVMATSAAGMAGAVSPVVIRRRPGGDAKRVELNVLGGYGVYRKRPTLGERAVSGLTAHLQRFRAERAATDAG